MKEDGMSRTMGQLGNNDYAVCFITAYQGDAAPEENEAANQQLAKDIRNLGYGFSKIVGGYTYKSPEGDLVASEPGYKVAIKVKTEEDEKRFVDEMMALGREYNQWSISLKTPSIRPAIYKTTADAFGDIEAQFDGAKPVNPQDTSTWQGGYTQMAKDVKKNPTRGLSFESEDEDYLSLTEEEYNSLPEYTTSNRGRTLNSMEERVLGRLTRGKLGLED